MALLQPKAVKIFDQREPIENENEKNNKVLMSVKFLYSLRLLN